jgi:uncharacterized protein YbcC (UPF0753/DUF2309 family)
VPSVTIGSGSAKLLLRAAEGSLPPEELEVELQAEALSAQATLYGLDFADLGTYFEGLASKWRGWAGSIDWRSLEGDLEISAMHERRVLLRIRLLGDRYQTEWCAIATIALDAGEELSSTAADVRGLVGRA